MKVIFISNAHTNQPSVICPFMGHRVADRAEFEAILKSNFVHRHIENYNGEFGYPALLIETNNPSIKFIFRGSRLTFEQNHIAKWGKFNGLTPLQFYNRLSDCFDELWSMLPEASEVDNLIESITQKIKGGEIGDYEDAMG